MGVTKISLSALKNTLTKAEMKKIMAGEHTGGGCALKKCPVTGGTGCTLISGTTNCVCVVNGNTINC